MQLNADNSPRCFYKDKLQLLNIARTCTPGFVPIQAARQRHTLICLCSREGHSSQVIEGEPVSSSLEHRIIKNPHTSPAAARKPISFPGRTASGDRMLGALPLSHSCCCFFCASRAGQKTVDACGEARTKSLSCYCSLHVDLLDKSATDTTWNRQKFNLGVCVLLTSATTKTRCTATLNYSFSDSKKGPEGDP